MSRPLLVTRSQIKFSVEALNITVLFSTVKYPYSQSV
jgi:hypothetical protein